MIDDKQTIRIAGIVRESIVDGPGIRFVVFCQGCPHHCIGCHNESTHSFDGGYDCDIEKIVSAIDENPLLSGVTFSGGEPVCQAESFLYLAKKIKKRNLTIIMYTGYTYEKLIDMCQEEPMLKELLSYVDVLIDGKYEQSERDLTLKYRGSRNQRVIDMNNTRKLNKLVFEKNT